MLSPPLPVRSRAILGPCRPFPVRTLTYEKQNAARIFGRAAFDQPITGLSAGLALRLLDLVAEARILGQELVVLAVLDHVGDAGIQLGLELGVVLTDAEVVRAA